MAILTREQILTKGRQLTWTDVPCPEWGGDVRIYPLTGSEREEYENKFYVEEKGKKAEWRTPPNVRALLVSFAARDEQGQRIFTEADIAALSEMSAAPLIRCFEAASKLAGLTPSDVKELTKDFDSGQA